MNILAERAKRNAFTPLETRVSRSSLTGFTLIEMVITVTIFAIIAVSIYSTFSAGIRVWLKTTPMIEANQGARTFFSSVSSDLKNAIVYNNLPAGTGSETGAGAVVNFEGTPDRMAFMCIMSVYDAAGGFRAEPAKVAYQYDKNDKTVKRLVATKAVGLDVANSKPVEMVGGVEEKDFSFEYCYKKPVSDTEYEYEWRNAWEGENVSVIPRGVRIRMGGLKKTVFIPAGELGKEE